MASPIQEYSMKLSSKHVYDNTCLLSKEFLWGMRLNFDNEVVMGASHILLIVFDMMSSRGSYRAATIALGLQPALLSPAIQNCFMLPEFFSFPVFNNSSRTPDILFAHSN